MNPLIGLVAVLAVEVLNLAGEAIHGRLMQPFRCADIYPVSRDREAVDGIALLNQVGDQIASYVPCPVAHLSQNLSHLGAEEIKCRIDHPAGLAARPWLLHEALDAQIIIHPGHAIRGDALSRSDLL